MFNLHEEKEYKDETIFLAAIIFDKYLSKLGLLNFKKRDLTLLSTTCMLLSAKMYQPLTPSFSAMIRLLLEKENEIVTKDQIIELEAHILITLGFDLNFPNPFTLMERYLRVLNYDQNKVVNDISF